MIPLFVGFLWMSTFLTRSSLAFSVLKRRGVVTSSAGVCSRFGGRQQPHLLFQNTPRYFSTSAIRMSALDDKLSGKRVVPVKECIEVHGEPGVVFIDGSWFLKDRNGRQEFEAGPRIPGAKFFDIDDIAAKGELNKKGLPHMMPPMKLFEAAMDAMDISDDDHLILYSSKGCMFIHRALYQIQAMGHNRDLVHLMDGSVEDWENEGGRLDTEPTKVVCADDLDLTKETKYNATDAQNVVDMEEVKKIIEQGDQADSIIVDARSEDRFYGRVDEPRPGLRLGHMPGAKNLFFFSLLDESNPTRLKSKEELKKSIANAGIDINTDKRIVASCGSGATACAVAAALDVCGRDPSKTYIYDGSWMEWGAEKETPITKEGDPKRKRDE